MWLAASKIFYYRNEAQRKVKAFTRYVSETSKPFLRYLNAPRHRGNPVVARKKTSKQQFHYILLGLYLRFTVLQTVRDVYGSAEQATGEVAIRALEVRVRP